MSTEGVTKEITGASLRREKIWTIGAEESLGLSRGFFLGMATPLNLVEENHSSPHDPILLT
jgi:hypothetical protein